MTRTMRQDDRLWTRRHFAGALAFAATALMIPTGARAQSLNDLRASGAVGEGFDGFARARAGSARSTVDAVNDKRKVIYAARAKEKGTAAAQVGRVYAKQIMGKAPAGTWFLQESGSWVQK